jgi:protein arginine N-methyltransferase 3
MSTARPSHVTGSRCRLPSVLYARDKYLKPGGALLPDRVALRAAAADASAAGLTFWDSVYGFSFPSVRASIAESCAGKPIVGPVAAKSLLTTPAVVQDLDLMHVTAADLDFHSEFTLRVTTAGACMCVVVWFDAFFSERFCTEAPAELSTAPDKPLTHWVQTTLLLKEAVEVAEAPLLD